MMNERQVSRVTGESSAAAAARPAPADLALVNARVITLDAASSVAAAVAVRGGRIQAVGDERTLRPLIGASTRVLDAGGRAVVPGLVDGHAHLDREGLKALLPSLAGCTSIDDVLQRIEALAREREPGEWIVTMPLGDPPYYWNVPDNLRERRFPTRRDLDRVAPRHPVYIRPIWGYWRHTLPLVSIASTRALEAAGITRATASPCPSVEIDTDSAGEPTGIFVEHTYVPIVELVLMPAATRFGHADRVRALGISQRAYHAAGTTSVFEGHGVAGELLRVYREVWAQGHLTMRAHLVVSPSWSGRGEGSFERFLGEWGAGLGGQGLGDDRLRVGGLHAEADPPADDTIRARALPYTGWAGFSYDAGLSRAEVKEMLLAAARHGIRVVSMGTSLLDLYAEVDREVGIRDRRWVLAHVSLLAPDEIGRIRDLGLVVTTHTNRHLYKEGGLLAERAGPDGEDRIVPLASLGAAGVPVALATDNVPPSLWYPVWQTVARRVRDTGQIVAPDQRLSREDALRAATLGGACLTFEEDHKGSIEPGKLADLAVLSANPLAVDEARLPEIVADITVVGGTIVWPADPGNGERWRPGAGRTWTAGGERG